MRESAKNYVTTANQRRFRRQALRAWGVVSAIVGVWLAAIIAAPLLRANGSEAAAAGIYSFFSYACHQIPERSLFLLESQLAVCSRCLGVYAGLFAGAAIYPLWRSLEDLESLPRIWLFLSLIPIGVDWSLTISGVWENTHLSRFVTGTILGAACATFIIPAVVEITRNLTSRKLSPHT